jgi:hypothetical protein
MSDQTWLAVTAMPSQDVFLSVWLDGHLMSPKPPGTNLTVRRCVSPGKHRIKVQVTAHNRRWSYQAISQFTGDVPSGSDYIILIKAREAAADDAEEPLSMSVSAARNPALWPLIPENIWGYSKDRCTIIEDPEEHEEPLITDVARIIDNASDATVTRSIQVSQDWKRTHTIEVEGSTTVGASIMLGASIGVKAEATLAAKYGASSEQTHTYTEEVSVSVPPHSKVKLSLAWKLRIRRGVLRYFDEEGFALIDVPFSVATGVTFDQITS